MARENGQILHVRRIDLITCAHAVSLNRQATWSRGTRAERASDPRGESNGKARRRKGEVYELAIRIPQLAYLIPQY